MICLHAMSAEQVASCWSSHFFRSVCHWKAASTLRCFAHVMVSVTEMLFMDPTFFPDCHIQSGKKCWEPIFGFVCLVRICKRSLHSIFALYQTPWSHVDLFLEDIPALSRAHVYSTNETLAKLYIPFSFGRCTGMSCLRTLVFVLRESLPVLMFSPY